MNKLLIIIGLGITAFVGWLFYEKPEPPFGGNPSVEIYYHVFRNIEDGTILEIQTTMDDYTQLGRKHHINPVASYGYEWVKSYSRFPESPTPSVKKVASGSFNK